MFYSFIWLPEKHFIGPYYCLKNRTLYKKRTVLKYRSVVFNFFLLIQHLYTDVYCSLFRNINSICIKTTFTECYNKKRNGELNQESGYPSVKADDSVLAVRLQLNTEIKQMSQKWSVVLMNAEEEDWVCHLGVARCSLLWSLSAGEQGCGCGDASVLYLHTRLQELLCDETRALEHSQRCFSPGNFIFHTGFHF